MQDLNQSVMSSKVFDIFAARHPAAAPPESEALPTGRIKNYMCGRPICCSGLARLLGIGSDRALKIVQAIRKKECHPPLDGRFACKPKNHDKTMSWKREIVHDFLHYLYQTLSEPMPEVVIDADPEGQKLQICKPLRFKKRKGKRPRILKKQDPPLTEAKAKLLRQLPPGSYNDYLRMFRAKHPEIVVSKKLFMRVLLLKLNTFYFIHMVLYFVFC